MNSPRIVFLLTHPIQYYSPLFKYLNKNSELNCEVWYFSSHGLNNETDLQFGIKVKWDIPLLDGYRYLFIKNNSWRPGVQKGFFGLINFGVFNHLRKLPKNSFVIITAWNTFSHLYSITLALLFGLRVCLRVESPLSHELNKGKGILWVRKIIFHILFKCVHKFLYIGRENEEFYKYYGVRDHDLIFTPYSVNNEYFQQEALNKAPFLQIIKHDLKIPLNYKVILYSGKLIPKKNPINLLKAFLSIPENLKCFLIFMGDGVLRKNLEEIVKESNNKNVLITGFVNQSSISNFYVSADIFVMCSGYGETWGLSTNEAMNFGLPVLISNLTGCSKDLVDGNGVIFDTDNIPELTSEIIKLVSTDREEIDLIKKRSVEIINGYSFSAIEKGLKKLVSEN